MDAYAELSASLSDQTGQDDFIGDAAIDIGLSVNTVTDISVYGISGGGTSALYSHVWPLWSQSFGGRRRAHASGMPLVLQSRSLTCSGVTGPSNRGTLVAEIISSEQ